MNFLYYGDNLKVLREHIKDETVDLVYLDPPFKSDQDYNVLFQEHGTKAAAQIKAFEDTWTWDEVAAASFEEVVEQGGDVALAMRAFKTFLGQSDMLAYLSMMAPRLTELRRVLKPAGSIYLHCDPTASHYLKMLMDAVFGPTCFVNEVIWKRTTAHSDAKQGSKHYGRTHDVLLFYVNGGGEPSWNPQYVPHDPKYIESHYTHVEGDRRYRWDNLTGPGGAAKGNPFYEVLGVKGYWRFSKKRMEGLIEKGLVAIPPKGKMPALKRYLDEHPGRPIGDVWTDIPAINSQAQERLGYPTQKPVALLERIITTSSSADAVVLDPFCGCGTTVAAAEKLKRKWIGIDITHLAISLIKGRLLDSYGKKIETTYKVIGEPEDLGGAAQLAKDDPFQFQWWALGLVGARPIEKKKGADKGIDGRLFFHDEGTGGKTKEIILSVKGGGVSVKDVRDLRGVIEREEAEMGVLVTLEQPTQPMKTEAASAGFYHSKGWNKKYARLQILTIAQLLAGKDIDKPPSNVTFKKAPKVKGEQAEQLKL